MSQRGRSPSMCGNRTAWAARCVARLPAGAHARAAPRAPPGSRNVRDSAIRRGSASCWPRTWRSPGRPAPQGPPAAPGRPHLGQFPHHFTADDGQIVLATFPAPGGGGDAQVRGVDRGVVRIRTFKLRFQPYLGSRLSAVLRPPRRPACRARPAAARSRAVTVLEQRRDAGDRASPHHGATLELAVVRDQEYLTGIVRLRSTVATS